MSIASVEQLFGVGGGNVPAVPGPAKAELPGLRKAAVFLAQMSKEEAGVLLSKLRPREVESLTRELMRLGSVEVDDVDDVMNEFHSLMTAQHFIGRGGVDFAREILAAGLGEDKAEGILSRLNVVYTEVPFASLRNADVRQLVTFLKDEHSQIRSEVDDVDDVMNEFHSLMTAQHFIGRGGVDFAREILAAGLGEDKAEGILSRLNVVYTEVPFASLRNADVRQLVTFLKDEHSQIIALV